MNFEIAYCTEVGCRKSVNQDSLYIKQIRLEEKNILLAVICDGMGGLAQGELASATVVWDFDKWFIEEFAASYKEKQLDLIKEEWIRLLNNVNTKILNYGISKGIQLGTTATAVLLFDDGKYLIRADFPGPNQDDKRYKVFDFNQSGTRVYLVVEGNRERVLPCDYEVEIYR